MVHLSEITFSQSATAGSHGLGAATLVKSRLNHLRALEAESLYILREAAAEFARPVMLYSIGKDSSVMLRLAEKAFFPGKIPFPLLHIDTSYKFAEMIEFRDTYTRQIGVELIVHKNHGQVRRGRSRGHVAGVLFVPRSVRDDELSPRGCEITVGYIDGDALFAFRAQAVRQ